MLRVIVLVLCLGSAGGIAAYSYYSRGGTGEPVYTAPRPSSVPAPYTPKASGPEAIAPDDLAGLARALQRELKRVGCYNGEISGVWTTSSRLAMKTFVERVNAALPIDKPDPVLLSLVQGYRERACGVGCPPGQTAQAGGTCVPSAVADKTPKELPPDAKADETSADTRKTATSATILAVPGAGAKTETKAGQDAGSVATAPQTGEAAAEDKPAKKPRRYSQQPPKLVRDFMKAFGIK
jgi:hypothetical protein